MEIFFIRHGTTKGNEEKRYVGSTDEGLSDSGKSNLLNIKYPDMDYIFTSPMKRCIETIEILFENCGYTIIDEIKEMDFGKFEYKNYDELKNEPCYINWLESGGNSSFPGGEDIIKFKNHCIKGFEKIIDTAKNSKQIAIVTHGGVIMSIMEKFYGSSFYEFQIENGSCLKCHYENRKISEVEKIV